MLLLPLLRQPYRLTSSFPFSRTLGLHTLRGFSFLLLSPFRLFVPLTVLDWSCRVGARAAPGAARGAGAGADSFEAGMDSSGRKAFEPNF